MRATLKTVPGVTDVDVDFSRARATVTLDTKKTAPEQLAEQLSVKTNGRYKATVVKN